MKERRLHLCLVSLILAGPVITSISGFFGSDFLFYIFPVTIDSIDLRVDPEQVKELRIAGFIIPLFNIKIIAFGIIALTKLTRRIEDKNVLSRLYVMVIVVSSARLLWMFLNYNTSADLYYFVGLFGDLIWTVGLVWVIKKRINNRTDKPLPV